MDKKIAIAVLTTAMMATPAFAASNSNQQQPQGAQQMQAQNNDQVQQSRNYNRTQQNPQNRQKSAQDQQSQQKHAQNDRAVRPNNLSRGEIRQVQQALDKDGFKAGTADARWGPRTQDAVKQFQQSKQIQANGKLDQQTVADLGLDTSKFSQSRE